MGKNLFDALATSDNQDDFLKAVKSINSRGETLQLDIQKYMTAVALRWQATGDVRPAVLRINALINKEARFKGLRWNAVLTYVEIAFGFKFVTEGDAKDTFIAGKLKAKDLDMDMFKVQANFWWNFVPEPEFVPLDLNALLAVALKKAEKAATDKTLIKTGEHAGKTKAEVNGIDPAQLEALRALVPAEHRAN